LESGRIDKKSVARRNKHLVLKTTEKGTKEQNDTEGERTERKIEKDFKMSSVK
jgi:hypothetical protein